MTVRAKFIVTKLEQTLGSAKDPENPGKYKTVPMVTVHANPVYGNQDPNHENTKFWQASPSGSLMLGTINPEAAAQFELGREYYVDFTPA